MSVFFRHTHTVALVVNSSDLLRFVVDLQLNV